MPRQSAHPLIYEINTWVWLNELTRHSGHAVTLANVPDSEWQAIADLGFDTVWLMGVWERSPAGVAISLEHRPFQDEFPRVLPDYVPAQDLVGSPYCVRRYRVDERFGGPAALAAVRKTLAALGMRLILDYVPNHVAPDHPWTAEHPEYFIRGTTADLASAPEAYFNIGTSVLARGKDPYFAPWPDVAQLNAFDSGLRQAVIETLTEIAAQCDGMRCDMAMLLISSVFASTWSDRAGTPPMTEYWREIIPAVKAQYPDCIFIAEAYWDMEWELQQQGFDYCYDKRLYDRLVNDDASAVRGHLRADLAYQTKLLRFIENHDEPRAAATFSPAKERVAAVAIATLPGARLIYDGQFDGRKVHLPVLLGRQPEEAADSVLRSFYEQLVRTVSHSRMHEGEWQLCETSGWPDNQSHEHLVAWCWRGDNQRALIVVNLSDTPAQGNVWLPWDDLASQTWWLHDDLSSDVFERDGIQMTASGLYVGMEPWSSHILQFQPATKGELGEESPVSARA